MRGIAFQPKVVDLLADLFGVIAGPFVIRGKKFYTFITHFGDRLKRAGQVFFQRATHGIELETDRNGRLFCGGEGNGTKSGYKGAAGDSGSMHGRKDSTLREIFK